MPRLTFSQPYHVEYLLDAEGNRVRKALGYELTASSRAARRQFCASHYNHGGSLDVLPPGYLVSNRKSHSKPPCFNFGLGVTTQQLYDYALEHKLVSGNPQGKGSLMLPALRASVKELDRVCGAKLSLRPVEHAEYQWIVSRFSNYTWHEDWLAEKEEQRVFDFLQEEFHITDMPRWYEDPDHWRA